MFVFKRRMNTEIESRTNENVTAVDVVVWNEVNVCVSVCIFVFFLTFLSGRIRSHRLS